MRPYFSLDIETTGLNLERSVPIQIGIVYDDGTTPLKDLKTFSIIIKRDYFEYAEPKALAMNARYFEKMSSPSGGEDICYPSEAYFKLLNFIKTNSNNSSYITIAGKNVGNYDIPILLNDMKKFLPLEKFETFKKSIRHRYLDVGSMYSTVFGYNPTLDEINRKIGYNEVTHDALDDAKNVVYAIRVAEFNMTFNET